jgi:DNA-binding transcriptional regulator LsrR (DeoR family)
VALAKEGLNQSEIANELELNKSNVSRHLRKARELGDVQQVNRPGN